MSFETIIGNNKIKQILQNAVSTGSVLHSYMFIGTEGIGKLLFAREFAQMILCEKITNNIPCGTCPSCTEFLSNNHPDFMEINAEDGKSIKIDQIRFLQEKIAEKPIVSNKKVYIINDSDTMTKESQNCLLKTLEEPPEYAIIILILSNENKMLNTIKSRCTKINFSPLTGNEINQYFNENHSSLNLNTNVLKLCGGSISKAIELQNESQSYNLLDNLINSFSNSSIIDIWNNSEILYKSKDIIQNLLEYMNIVFMNNLLETNELKYINIIKYIEEAKKRLVSNANFDMTIDNLLLKIWEEFNEKYSRC